MRWPLRDVAALSAVLGLALLLRLASAMLFVNEIWPDEIFQTLEQAHRLAFGYGVVPWEFRVGSRSWLLPGALAGIMKAAASLGSESAYRTWVSISLVGLSLVPIGLVFSRVRAEVGVYAGTLAGLVVACWFELIYFAPKALSEVVAGHLLVMALLLEPRHRPALCGTLLGLVCALRIQLAPAVLLAVAFDWRVLARAARTRFAVAGLTTMLISGLLDGLTWSYPFQSLWKNVVVNVVEGKSARYGTAPVLAYFDAELKVLGWAALPLFVCFALGALRLPKAAWAALVTFGVHSLLAHKEYRFVFPAVAIVVTTSALGVAAMARKRGGLATAAALVLMAASAFRAPSLRTEHVNLALGLYPSGSLWSNNRGPLLGFERLSSDPSLCGVGLLGVPWYLSGGYSWLHRHVPITEFTHPSNFGEEAKAVNALLVREGAPAQLGPFLRDACWPGACIYRRPGSCTPVDGDSLNARLRERGE